MVGDAVALGDDVLAGADGDAVHARDERGAGLLGEGLEQGVVADRGGDEARGVVVLGDGADVRHGRERLDGDGEALLLGARATHAVDLGVGGGVRGRGVGGDPVAGGRRGLGLVARERKRSDGRLGVGVLERDATVDEARLRATHGGEEDVVGARSACAGGCDGALTTTDRGNGSGREPKCRPCVSQQTDERWRAARLHLFPARKESGRAGGAQMRGAVSIE